MIRIRRDILIIGAIFLALAAFLVLVPAQEGQSLGVTSHSSGASGTLALYRWLGDLEYNVDRLEYRDFVLDSEADLLFVVAPSDSYSPAEADAVMAWVDTGGTLILIEDQSTTTSKALLRAIGVSFVAIHDPPIRQAALTQPVASVNSINTETQLVMENLPPHAALIVGSERAPVLVGMAHGKGYIYLSTALRPFTNVGLADTGSAGLVLGLMRRVPPAGNVIFDEYHHGFNREPSLGGLLLGSPWGWAVIYASLVGALYVVLSGRRFGTPIPLHEETVRRSSAEYLASMAGLLRRGRKSGYLLTHYRVELKRRLARPYGISPDLEDEDFVAALASARPLDSVILRDLLFRMRQPVVNDAELLRLIAESDQI